MTRLDGFVTLPPRYAQTAQGLDAAEQKLARLTVTHTAYANQPNISKLWQGYVDKQAGTVDTQRTLVEVLRRTVAGSDTIEAADRERSTAQA